MWHPGAFPHTDTLLDPGTGKNHTIQENAVCPFCDTPQDRSAIPTIRMAFLIILFGRSLPVADVHVNSSDGNSFPKADIHHTQPRGDESAYLRVDVGIFDGGDDRISNYSVRLLVGVDINNLRRIATPVRVIIVIILLVRHR